MDELEYKAEEETDSRVAIPLDPEATELLTTVRRYAKVSRDDALYGKLYTLALFMSGDAQTLDQFLKTGYSTYANDPDLGYYPEITPDLGPEGVQNHLLLNSRINIQAIAYSNPRFMVPVADPLIREIVHAWLSDVWDELDMSSKSYEVGLDTECFGMGFCEFGTRDGGPAARTFSPLDCLWDRFNRNPADWRYFFVREYLDIEEALERYGAAVSREEMEELLTPMRSRKDDRESANADPVEVIVTWRYWSKKGHAVFLGPIKEEDSIILGFEDDTMEQYARLESGRVGINPFGVIPVATWTDSMSPGVRTPASKAETAIRQTSLLNKIEKATGVVLDKGAPRWIISALGLDPATISKLKEGGTLDELGEVIVSESEKAVDGIHVTNPVEIPNSWLQARSMLKEELNTSTGVMDSMRGVTLPGERTALEVRTNEANGGIQSRHTQKQYQRFLKQVVKILMAIGAKHESKRRLLVLNDGFIDTAQFPVRPFLALDVPVGVQEDSLRYVTEQERRQQRMIEFQTVDMQAIVSGVADPYKVFFEVYQDMGLRDPSERLYSKEEFAMMQMQRAVAESQQPQEQGEEDAA